MCEKEKEKGVGGLVGAEREFVGVCVWGVRVSAHSNKHTHT